MSLRSENPCQPKRDPLSLTQIINLSAQNKFPVFLVGQSNLLLLRSYIRNAASLCLATGLIGCSLNIFYVKLAFRLPLLYDAVVRLNDISITVKITKHL